MSFIEVVIVAAAAAADNVVVWMSRVSRSRSLRIVDFCNVWEPNDGLIPLSPRSRSFSTGVLMFNDDANAMGCKCQGLYWPP